MGMMNTLKTEMNALTPGSITPDSCSTQVSAMSSPSDMSSEPDSTEAVKWTLWSGNKQFCLNQGTSKCFLKLRKEENCGFTKMHSFVENSSCMNEYQISDR